MSTQEKTKRIVVIGGGPAGMAAAIFASRGGGEVTLLERNEKLGKKLYITGKGRCNVTNAARGEDFMKNIPRNPRFLYAALDHLDSQGLRDLLQDLGCETMVERGQRVFPLAQKASDITRALARGLAGVDLRLGAQVSGVAQTAGGFLVTLQGGETLRAGAVILATGGLSYPMTGSTGDGYRFAKALQHGVSACSPALVPLETADTWSRALQGLTLKQVTLTAREGDRLLFQEQGELLFTHFGISGPLVLSLSSVLSGRDLSGVALLLDMKPALSQDQLLERLKRMLLQGGRRQLKSILPELLPGKMVEVFPALCPADFHKQLSQVTAADRALIAGSLKRIPLAMTGLRGFNEAVITRGGVEVKDINPSTMGSRLVPGLYFAGEVIDVDGLTGGFNLQIAFSTGALAGASAAGYLLRI
ncbi:MAG: NAD(P)/FAD-dependent oxidoreductase [Christensenellales bacterium]